MALTTLSVGNADHFAKGGVKKMTLGTFDSTLAFTVGSDHDVTGFVNSATTYVIEFEKETAKLATSTSQEKGLSMTTANIECYIPKMAKDRFKVLEALKGQSLYGAIEMWNGEKLLVGWDNVLGDSTAGEITSDFALFLEGIDGESGGALADANGITLKLMAVQGEELREYAV